MKETILIIDDEQDILILLSSLLESEGYNIHTARNGREGIQKFQEINPDLILTDIRMPVMDGLDVLREVKTKEANTEVIILTGHSDEATAIDCLRHGAYDYFCKPKYYLCSCYRSVLSFAYYKPKRDFIIFSYIYAFYGGRQYRI